MSFPQIIIRGRYIGGSDDLELLINNNQFNKLILMNHIEYLNENQLIEWYEPLLASSLKPNLFQVPGDSKYFSKWYCFQFYMYSNLVRYISIFHTIILSISLIIIPLISNNDKTNSNLHSFLQAIISILLVDILIILIFGPSPLSLSGSISTYFCWKYKGNITSSLPYKFVWSIYIFALAPFLFENNLTSDGAIASITSILTNSILLVVFRF